MAVTNLYPNLPGHLVEFKDGGLQLTSDTNVEASGKSLLILGTAFDGPINEPVKIDATTVTQLFGSEVNEKGYPNGATLTKYAKQAFKNGFTDVRCMRVTGSLAQTTLSKTEVTNTYEEVGTATAKSAGIANDLSIPIPTASEGPIVTGSVVITDNGNIVTPEAFSKYATEIIIKAGTARKGVTFNYTYKYKKYVAISEKIADTTSASSHPILTSNETLYVADVNNTGDETKYSSVISDFKIVDDSTTAELTEGVDYQWSGKDIVFLGTYASTPSAVTITGAKFTIESITNNQITPTSESSQVITLDNTPVTGSVVVKAKAPTAVEYTAVDNAYITVSNKEVSINPAAALAVDGDIAITYNYEVQESLTESMIVRAIYGGSIYKTATVQVLEATDGSKVFVFTKPASKKYTTNEAPLKYSSNDFPTVGALKSALKNTALNNVFEIVTDNDDITTADFPVTAILPLSDGGEDGVVVTNNQMFEALSGKRNVDGYLIEQGAYQILENYNVDYIYPAGVYANSKQTVNPNSSFHHELALLCAVLTYRTKMTHGFIDVKPNANTTLVGIQKYVDELKAYNNTHYMKDENGDDIVDSEGNKMDIGWYTSVVVGPEPVMVSDTLGTYYGSPAIAYAALNASIKPQSAPTNKALPGVKGMKFKFSNKQMNELVGNRMVVFKLKNEGTATASSIPYVVDGCTAGAASSDYARLSTVKIVTDVVDQIREVSDPFIGEPNTIEQRNALSALISKRLSYLMEQGEIQYYEFEINATIQQVVLGECSIALTLVCPMELRKITTVVALRAAA